MNRMLARPNECQRSQSPITILLIDDAETDCVTYTRYLEADANHHYRILIANDLRAGIALWRSQSFDVVLLDVNLPDGDGLEFLEFLQTNGTEAEFQAKAPVIVLTGQGNERVAVRAMKLGAMDYLSKGDITATSLQKSVLAVVKYQTLAQQLLRSQQQKELLSEIALQIRQSLDLSQILQSAVDGVRRLLSCDRAIIYQFHADWSGWVAVESARTEELSILNREIVDPCFASHWYEPYRQGRTSQVNDIADGSLTPCHADLLVSMQVRAHLIVPILHNEHLWGLLIAHECYQPRFWEISDIQWVQQLATQASIAIQQATAYINLQVELRERQQAEAQLQQLNQELEERVARRTTALQQSEVRLREAQQLAHLGYWEIDTSTGKITWSPELFRIFGFDPNQPEPSYDRILQQFSELDRDRLNTAIQAAMQTGEIYELDLPFSRADGSSGCVFLRGKVICNEQGEPVRRAGIMVDISDRYQLQAKLQNLSDRLTLALESAEIGTWDWDRVHEATWDDRMYILYGLQHLQRPATYQDWLDALHPDDRTAAQRNFECSIALGKFNTEFRIVLPDGNIRHIKAVGLMDYDHLGQPQRMVGINYDVTAHKQAEAASVRYTQEIEDLYNHAPCGYHSLDPEGRLIRVNETELQWLGYTREEMVGQPLTKFLTEASQQVFLRNYEILCQQGWVQNLEYEMVCQDGSHLPVLVSATAVKDGAGNYLYNRATLLDISDRKAVESALKASETKFRCMAESIPGMIYSYVLHPDGRDEFTYVSPHAWDIYELESEAIEKDASCLWSRIHPDDISLIQTETKVSAEALQPFFVEHRLITPKGGLKWVQLISCPERQTNGDLVWNGVVQDISDRKAAEAQLQQTNIELARATRLKDEFLANMSHELRTPLNAILGLSESLQEQILGALDERQIKAIATIERSGRHLLELINDILDLAKISSGKMELDLAPASVQYLCDSSLVFVKQQAFHKAIQVTSDIATNASEIIIDERRIRQVLINLLTNAVKFTPEGGQVRLEVKEQIRQAGVREKRENPEPMPHDEGQPPDAPAQPPGSESWTLFSVIDTGIGIRPDDLSRLFQPFMQIDSSLNRQQSGTGLGLAMVKQITELHGGWVTVESDSGHGSCFTIALPNPRSHVALLPVDPLPEETSPTLTVASPKAAIAPCILLAEDNQANVATFTSYLSAHHYRMMMAQNGEEAVALAKAEHPDLILMDIQMPGMDGLEAIRRIRADEQLATVPIIALTALAMPEDQDRCIAAGANQYLSKPIKLRQLVETIQQWLSDDLQ